MANCVGKPGEGGWGDRPRRRSTWSLDRVTGGAGALHGLGIPDEPARLARVLVAERPALVLGSTQVATDVDEAAAARLGVEVVRRRSGGGAVLLDRASVVWVDLVLPAGDPLWHDDVGRAAWWVGHAWAHALADLGVDDAAVHEGGLVRTSLSARVCFAGVGPGEVLVGGRKVVGVSQRRTRAAALFQCALLLRWEPERYGELLGIDPAALAGAAVGLPLAPDDAVAALVDALPA